MISGPLLHRLLSNVGHSPTTGSLERTLSKCKSNCLRKSDSCYLADTAVSQLHINVSECGRVFLESWFGGGWEETGGTWKKDPMEKSEKKK